MRIKDLPHIDKERLIRYLARCFPCEYTYWYKAKYLYEKATGRKLNYASPQTLGDKLMWLTRYWRHPLKTVCADKYRVREYVEAKQLGHILIPLLAVYDRSEDIDFAALPQSFVLKCNHGSGMNLIVTDKAKIDPEAVRQQFARYLMRDFSQLYCEKHYDDIPRKIVCEPLIATSAPTEYQCWCVNGEPDSLLVCRKNFDGTYDAFSYSCDFRQLFERKGEKPNEEVIARPACLEQILDYARILSADFPFVRADFYEVEGKVYFAELTFTPNCNYLLNYNEPFLQRLGSKLKLPCRKLGTK